MNCQNCGHPIEWHDIIGCQAKTDQNDSDAEIESNECPCVLNEAQATRLAQRRKAADRYSEIYQCFNEVNDFLLKSEWKSRMVYYVLALKDTGILAPGETEQALLKELE